MDSCLDIEGRKQETTLTSEDHPECFAQIAGPMEPSEAEKRRSETAMAAAGTADLSATA
jgi:hypothetical protein